MKGAHVCPFQALGSIGSAPLEKLYLDNNQIGEAGVAALSKTLRAGQLPCLKSLHLSGNPIPPKVVSAVVECVERQAGGDAPLRPAPQTRDLESAPVD